MNMSALLDKCFRELSGGQQQRVLLARALCSTGKILLLDEPVAGLDPEAQEEMYRVIKGLHEEGVTVIMISHDVHAALRYATHILHIGEEVFFGTREEYLESKFGKQIAEAEQKAREENGPKAEAYSADYRPKAEAAAEAEDGREAEKPVSTEAEQEARP